MAPRILVLEDELQQRLVIRDYLVATGYEVDVAPNIRAFHDAVNAEDDSYDLWLMDRQIEMPAPKPNADSIDTLRWLRQRGYNTPALIVSGAFSDDEQEAEVLRERLVVHYERKPLRMKSLVQKIEQVLAMPQMRMVGRLSLIFDQAALFDGQSIPLTQREFHILERLTRVVNLESGEGRLVSRENLMAHLDEDLTLNTLSQVIARLNKKFTAATGHEPIHNNRERKDGAQGSYFVKV